MKTSIRLLVAALGLAIVNLSTFVGQAEDYTYTTSNGTITITAYTGLGGDVIIPDTINGLPVTSIGVDAFLNCTSLTSITIPDSVTSMGDGAFRACIHLIAIKVDALNPCYSSMDGVLFNKSQTTLIQYPGGGVGSYMIPDGVTSIGDRAFACCFSLTNVTVGSSVTNIGQQAFESCTSLTSITIPGSVTSIGGWAFGGCTSLTAVTIPNSVSSIGNCAFSFCRSLTSVTFPNSVSDISGGAFCFCNSLTNVSIPDSVSSIGEGAFLNCADLTSITIPGSVTKIGGWAFYGCSSLTIVTIPNSVTTIDGSPFPYCTSLIAITVDTLNPSYSSMDGVLFNKSQTTLIQCPGGKAGAYSVPNIVTGIVGCAFYGCASLTNITIPDGVSSIGYGTFALCTNLTGVYFAGNAPESVDGESFDCYVDTETLITVPTIVYYLPGTTGWGTTFGRRPTSPWVLPYPVILTTAPSLGIQTTAFGFRISWATNAPVVVEASQSLTGPTWSAISTNTLTDGWSDFTDPDWVNHPSRFYRVRSQ